jgi:hypothetical protein
LTAAEETDGVESSGVGSGGDIGGVESSGVESFWMKSETTWGGLLFIGLKISAIVL